MTDQAELTGEKLVAYTRHLMCCAKLHDLVEKLSRESRPEHVDVLWDAVHELEKVSRQACLFINDADECAEPGPVDHVLIEALDAKDAALARANRAEALNKLLRASLVRLSDQLGQLCVTVEQALADAESERDSG